MASDCGGLSRGSWQKAEVLQHIKVTPTEGHVPGYHEVAQMSDSSSEQFKFRFIGPKFRVSVEGKGKLVILTILPVAVVVAGVSIWLLNT